MSHQPGAHIEPHQTTHHSHQTGPPAHPRRWWLLSLLCLAQFMLIADVTVINVALPTIGDELSLGAGGLTWVVTAYTLCFGSLLLLGGRAADTFGKLRMFLTGLAVFTAASLASGLAANGGMLIASRSAQGVGAALLSPAAMSLITTLFQGPDRNKALGVWAAIGGAGSAIGVLLGGVLVSGPGWEWIFFINIPVGLVAFLGVPALLGDARARTGPSGVAPRLDVAGAVTLTAAPALLIYGLVQAREHGFGAMGAWLPLLVALACVTAFVAVERSVREPLVRLELLARRSLVGGGLVMLAASGLLISSFFLNSFYLQHVLGYSALRTGLISANLPLSAPAVHALRHRRRHLMPARGTLCGYCAAQEDDTEAQQPDPHHGPHTAPSQPGKAGQAQQHPPARPPSPPGGPPPCPTSARTPPAKPPRSQWAAVPVGLGSALLLPAGRGFVREQSIDE